MDETRQLVRITLRPSGAQQWSGTPLASRIRRLLKYAGRAAGLDCLKVEEIPAEDPEAYSGWLLFAAGWKRVCCAITADQCAQLLLERQDKGILARRVLPRGEAPREEAQQP